MNRLCMFVILAILCISGCGGGGGGGGPTAHVVITATLSELPPENQAPANVDGIHVTISVPNQLSKVLELEKVSDILWVGNTEIVVANRVEFRAYAYQGYHHLYSGTVIQDVVADTNNSITIIMHPPEAKTAVNITATIEDSPGAIRDASDIKIVSVNVSGWYDQDIELKKVSDLTWAGSIEVKVGPEKQFTVYAQESAPYEDMQYAAAVIFRGKVTQDVIYGAVNDVNISATFAFPPESTITPPQMTGIDPEVGMYCYTQDNYPPGTYMLISVTQDPITGKKYAHYSGDGGRSYDATKIVRGAFYNVHPDSWYGYTISGWFTTPTHVETDQGGNAQLSADLHTD